MLSNAIHCISIICFSRLIFKLNRKINEVMRSQVYKSFNHTTYCSILIEEKEKSRKNTGISELCIFIKFGNDKSYNVFHSEKTAISIVSNLFVANMKLVLESIIQGLSKQSTRLCVHPYSVS